MSFSGILQVTDLNDFLGPSQACIKPPEIKKGDDKTEKTIKHDLDSGRFLEVSKDGEEKLLETATVSLNDCLACSGCVTSAESVLIAMQSHHDLLNALKERNDARKAGLDAKTVVVTLAPQSRASFAAKYDLSPLSVHKRLAGYFKSIGVDFFFDASFGRDFSLLESAKEFVERYGNKSNSDTAAHLPMLASACPGWICYAEKTHPDLLPFISTVKSPQQVMGYLVKSYLAKTLNLTPDAIVHVTVMPCYDKKLEASRNDFYNDLYRTRDVDSVITSGELERLLAESNLKISDLEEGELPSMFTKSVCDENGDVQLSGSEGSSSGGYTSFIFRYAAKHLFDITLPAEDIASHSNVLIQPGKNSDYMEMVLQRDGEELLRFAIANGFRNIQNLVRKIKPADSKPIRGGRASRRTQTSTCQFIEVMACPSGCINGGGQLKPGTSTNAEATFASKEITQKAEAAYKSVRPLFSELEVNSLYRVA
ncbi:hypothetical protein HDU97_006669 [Phlyctochytrium planicorne]|nr:hypothetical protein HDU97_006669 [Phlyctochytrium planicorne]